MVLTIVNTSDSFSSSVELLQRTKGPVCDSMYHNITWQDGYYLRMKKTYYIFRHGLTKSVKKNHWYWRTLYSAQIIDEGKPSIERLAAYLKDIQADYYVCSPFLRCRQTAEIVSKATGEKFTTDKRLGEYVFELPGNFKRRILSFISEMETSNYKTIVICTHLLVIEMLIQFVMNGKLRIFHRLTSPLTGVLTVIEDGKISEKNFNNEKYVRN